MEEQKFLIGVDVAEENVISVIMNYKVNADKVKIKVYSTITKELKERGYRSNYKNYAAIAEWEVDNTIYVINAEGDTPEDAYLNIRNKLRKKGISITKQNIINLE